MRRPALLGAVLALGLATLAAGQTIQAPAVNATVPLAPTCANANGCKVWYAVYGAIQTNANGQWTATVPASVFPTAIVGVIATPVSTDNTAPQAAYASVTAPAQSGGAWTVGGLVLLPSTVQALGALSAKAAGQGTVVMVTVVGY